MKMELNLKTRRRFLKSGVLGAAATWTLPAFLARTVDRLHAASADSAIQTPTGKDAPILVVLQMAGGHDGLNSVVSHADDHYHRARPSLRIPTKDLLRLDGHFGLHPALAGLKELFDDGSLSIIHGVGYPNPNRSHFRSTEIWQTASDSNRFEKHGWIGRYFDHACDGCEPTVGINIGRQTPQAFASAKPVGVSLENPQNYRFYSRDSDRKDDRGAMGRFFRELNGGMAPEPDGIGMSSGDSIGAVPGRAAVTQSPLDYLERTALDAQISSDQILAVTSRVHNQASYPASSLANSLCLVARLIGGGMPTRIYYVSQGGYDTHTNQMPAHERLLRELAGSVKAFVDDLKAQGNFGRVLLMTFSEFGRRVAQNANGGTDHGAAAPIFMVGSAVKSSFVGRHPSLAPRDLHNGDLKFTTDFRSIYAGVLEGWLRTPSVPILGRKFSPVTCV